MENKNKHNKIDPGSHEIKYTVENSRSPQIIKWLRSVCRPDPEFPEGTVSSIYYDTRDWRFLSEKINSDYIKTKIRIRWYSDLNDRMHSPQSFLEAKRKSGSRRKKIRIVSPFSGDFFSQVRLEDSILLKLPQLLHTRNFVFNGNVFPAFQISYKRIRFCEPVSGTRLCFDFDIHAPRRNFHILPRFKPFKLNTAVFEMKGEMRKLPFTLNFLTQLGLRKSSFSKYGSCYQALTNPV